MSLTRFAVKNRPLTLVLLVSLMGLGVLALLTLSRREDPDLEGRFVRVVAIYPGATASEVEQLVTERLERTLMELDDIKSVRSMSRPGQAVLDVEAADRARDLKKFRDELRNRVTDIRASFPSGVLAVDVNDRFADTAALILGVTMDGASGHQLDTIARTVRDRLRTLPDASQVDLIAEPEECVRISLSPQRMAQLAVTPGDVARAISQHNVLPETGGSVAAGTVRFDIQPSGDLHSIDPLRNLVVAVPGGIPVHLSEIATIERTYADPPTFLMRVNGKPAVGVSVTMRKGESITALGDRVAAMNADLHRDLPPGAHITVVNDLPRSVRGRIAEFNTNLLSGVVLIIGVLYLFMGLRSALIVGIMLPITMLGTFALMYVFGRDLQQISITALIISVGLVVDNSIVVIDNIERKLSEGMNGERAVIEGVDQVRVPLLTSNLTTVASFAPLLLLSGSVGEFIRDLGIVTSLATLVSLLLNYTIAPLIALRFLKGSHEDRPNSVRRAFLRGVDCLRESTSWLAAGALRRARLTVSAAIALLCLTAALVPHLGMQFFPSAVRNQFQIDINLPEGRDIQATSRVASRVEAIVRAHQGIESVTSYIGQGGPRFYYNVNQEAPNPAYAQVVVNIDNADRAHALVDAIQSEANHTIADARVTVKSLEQGPPIGPPIAIRLSGTNISELRSAGEKLKEVLNGTPGAASVYQDYDEPRLTLHAAVNEEQARLAGVSSQSVADAVRMGFSGLEVSTLRDGDREIPIELRAVPEERSDAASIGDMPVVGESGTVVPLRQVAALSLAPEESRIMRRNHVRTLTVFAYTDGSRLASDILGEVRRRLPSLNLPQSVAVSYGGEQEEAGRSFTELILVMGVTIAANLVIVVWEFNSFPVALTILAAIPLSLIGAIFGLYCMGLPFGFIAFIGIVGLGGIVTNHAIVLFEYAQAEQRAGHPLDEALVVAGRRRLRPILLTVLLSIFGLLPQAVNGGTLWPPLAWAQIFGLLASLVLTLAVVPSVYKVLSMRRRREIATERVPAAQLPEQQASGVR